MSTQVFVPLAESINAVGFIPDPDNPPRSPLPPLPETNAPPFEPIPEFPEPRGSSLVPCRLDLKQGCYQIRMENSGFQHLIQPRFLGTMRVEKGDDHTTISGDFYKFYPRIKRGFVESGLTNILLDNVANDAGPMIPVFPRKRYYSYLKVTKIQRSLAALSYKPCTITLTVEEFQYTPPDEGEATGSFPQMPNRTLTIVLTKVANPDGFPGPSFEGTVFQGNTQLREKFYMTWVSDFFRRARLELENVTGVAIPAPVGVNDFRSIYATAGWDLTVVTGDIDLPVPSNVSANNPWTSATLHQFMQSNRNPSADLDKEWQMYHVSVPFDFSPDSGIFGIMFDQIQDEREGACNFIQNMTGKHNNDRAKLRSAAHEVGHGFNQLHPPTEDQDSDNSIMSQSGPVSELLGSNYPNGINFAFNAHDRHHLIHFPDVVVRPGGEDFRFGHPIRLSPIGSSPEAQDNADVAGIELHMKMDGDRLKLGEPLMLRLELVNNGKHKIRVPINIGSEFDHATVTVRKGGEGYRYFHPFVTACDGHDNQELRPGQSVGSDETIYWDRNGCVFQAPGLYVVSATVSWEDGGQPFAAKASVNVWVDYPATDKDNQVAAMLLHDEVGKYIALGGNANHLNEAVARLGEAAKFSRNHPAVVRINQMNEAGKKPRVKKKRSSS